jgi:hypothetical protein
LKNTLTHTKRAAHHFNPCFIGGNCRTVEKYLTRVITKEQHITLIPVYGIGWTVEKYSNTCNHKKEHITLIPLHRWNWVGLLKNTLTHVITKEQHITLIPAL